jgi:hypothetical protein
LGASPAGQHYLSMHDAACAWAKRNRALIANRFLSCLSTNSAAGSRCVMDIWHNNVVAKTFSQPCFHNDALNAFYPLATPTTPTDVTAFTKPNRSTDDADADIDNDNDVADDKPEDYDAVLPPSTSSKEKKTVSSPAVAPSTVTPSAVNVPSPTPAATGATLTSTSTPSTSTSSSSSSSSLSSSSSTSSSTTTNIEAKETSLWLHRKGAAPGDMGPLVIPGSRGAFSYLVQPIGDRATQEYAGYSLAHGAGYVMACHQSVLVISFI